MGRASEALCRVREKAAENRRHRTADFRTRVIVGTATCGVSAGARAVVDALVDEIAVRKLDGVIVTETGCSGRCDLEPLVQVQRHGEPPVLYCHIDADKARRIVGQHVQNNEPVLDWVIT